MFRRLSFSLLLSVVFALPQMLSAQMVGEWLFTDGKDTVARVGNDLERVTRTGNADFTTVSGLYMGDGAVRVGQNNYYKCLHGLPKGAVYSVVMDVRAPAETASTASYHALFQPLAANGGDPAYYLCYTKTDSTLKLWYKKGTTIALSGATLDQWNRYVITWDGTNKAIYLNGQLIQTDADTKLRILEDNSWFYFFADNNGEDLGLDVTYAAVYDETLSAETIATDHVAPQAHNAKGEVLTDDEVTEVVGEWLFTAGSETVARVGNDLERVTRTGSENFQVVPGIYHGDGAICANRNNYYKCTHGLAVDSSYTVVMDVSAPTATSSSSYHALFQPLASNGRDPAYFLCYTSTDPTIKLWYAPQTLMTLEDVKLDQWNRYVITWDNESKQRVIYLNGKKVLADSLTPTLEKMPITSAGYFFFLADNDGEDYGLNLTYAALYDCALTAEEIARFHTAPVAHDAEGNVMTEDGPVTSEDVIKTFPWQQNVLTDGFSVMCETFGEVEGLELQWGADFAETTAMTGVETLGGHRVYTAKVSVADREGECIAYRLAINGTPLAGRSTEGMIRLWKTNDTTPFTAVIWGDNQQGLVSGYWDQDRYLYVTKCFEHMMSRKPDFGVTTGDLATDAVYDSQIEPLVLQRTNGILGSKIPYYIAWGNHDSGSDKRRMTRNYFEPTAGHRVMYRGNTMMVLVDYEALGGCRTTATKEWLESVLSSERAQAADFRLVFVHEPVYLELWGGSGWSGFAELYTKYGVDIVFSGHMHGYERIEMPGSFIQITNGGLGYLDYKESVTRDYAEATKLGGHVDLPYLMAAQESVGVLGALKPVRAGLIHGYGEIHVDGRALTYRAHGFNENGDYLGVYDAFTLTARKPGEEGVLQHSHPDVEVPSTRPPSDLVIGNGPITKSQWAKFEEARGRVYAFAAEQAETPATGMSRREAEAFARWVSGDGKIYRLPTKKQLSEMTASEVAEWTSETDDSTGWCAIHNCAVSFIATPDCSASYLGFRLVESTGFLLRVR